MMETGLLVNSVTMLDLIPILSEPGYISLGMYAQNGLAANVLELCKEMKGAGVCPDAVTFVWVLSSCAHLGAISVGREVEQRMESSGVRLNPFLNNALINMYGRCDNLIKADAMPVETVVSWTAIIGGYGMHGYGETVVDHAGLTGKGLDYFSEMKTKHRLQPGPEHYSCMVHLLGRAGRLNEAFEAHQINAEAENLEGILKVRVMMRDRKLKKDPGFSYLEYKGGVHLFLPGDKSHPQKEEIYRMVDKLESLVKKLDGYKDDEERRNREHLLGVGVHSEKLAIVFGLLNSEPGTEIVVIKNLRICEGCHLFLKGVSKIVDRQLVRDATHFHHFRDGLCSCKDH
ncbi:4'-phosphopantetheinyl transferase superfamily [Hibiscus syriacus]|uniref:4'-phosphopantetheinyl transferase superfamily n=1 Tax=Hibiscus syriacus TaxID=106335 RepID=A0A6A2XCJ3_HIBSY|nr:4'-phosphopantetheinyl transferase superfamily [Hibiscus syriacus]